MILFIRLWATAHEILPIKISKAMLTQQKFNKVFRFETLISVSIVSNNIFWKRLTRPFRCIYVNCFNILNFFCWGQYKIEKMHLFDNLRIITQEGNMKTTQITPFFHLLFLLYLLVTFISEFENTYNSFSNLLLRSTLVCKIPQFFAKSYWFGQLIILFQKVDTLRLLKIYIMFCLPAKQIPIFLGSSSWTILEVEENFIPNLFAFLLLFWWQKK